MRKASFKPFKAIQSPQEISLDMLLTKSAYKKLSWGLKARQMEDKWDVFEEGNHIHFIRSWTGHEIFRANITRISQDTFQINSFMVETDAGIYKSDSDEREIAKFSRHIDSLINRDINDPVRAAVLGHLVGDALGVPAEFKDRSFFEQHPVTDMTGYGTHNQPPGTWSDDGAMMLATMEALCHGYSVERIAENFVKWYTQAFWSPYGEVFDIGIATREAIERLQKGVQPESAGGFDEYDNGNGSLMRIIPMYFFLNKEEDPVKKFQLIRQVSGITHGHLRSALACFVYLEIMQEAEFFFEQNHHHDLKRISPYAIERIQKKLDALDVVPAEKELFAELLNKKFLNQPEHQIASSGYVMHTLEASIWCLINSESYKEAVLKAVNLGDDTDTTAAVTGGLAALLYGEDAIPQAWISQLARLDEIEDLIERFSISLYKSGNL